MKWLWFVGPIALALIYILTGLPGSLERRRAREVELWRASWGPKGAKRVSSLPTELAAILPAVGIDGISGIYTLVPKLAYLVVGRASLGALSDVQAVVCKLADAGPTFTLRPLPTIDGVRVQNTGIVFTKDPEFSTKFLVEGVDQKATKRWLGAIIREELADKPDLWLHVDGSRKLMALAQHGSIDADALDDLVSAADVLFAEHGADGGPSLLGEDAPPAPKKKGAPPKNVALPKKKKSDAEATSKA